jgi:hypothetical protein
MVAQQVQKSPLEFTRHGRLRHLLTSPAGCHGYYPRKQASVTTERNLSSCAAHQARTEASLEEKARSTVASDRLASHSQAGSSDRNPSHRGERSQAVLEAVGVTSQDEQKTPIAHWKAFQASYQPFRGSHCSAEKTYKCKHLQDYLSQSSISGQGAEAAALISACMLAAEEGFGHEIVAVLHERHLTLEESEMELTSSSACAGLIQVCELDCQGITTA